MYPYNQELPHIFMWDGQLEAEPARIYRNEEALFPQTVNHKSPPAPTDIAWTQRLNTVSVHYADFAVNVEGDANKGELKIDSAFIIPM